ncbi:MAG TPA: ABC transporter substrate-binding protein [Patescibacteria group bacterium]|nr:ABC transporter substrate-binding protein [Patescibacteria group bacterium]
MKAYIRKWKRTIFFSFGLGLVIFFLLYLFFTFFQPSLPLNKTVIGLAGSYSSENLPSEVQDKISSGLTGIAPDGKPIPSVASSWEIKDDGKTYIFNLKNNLHFTDGSKLTSSSIIYNFENVSVERPTDSIIIFKLKNSYSPFLVSVSKPILKKNFVGLGNYKVGSLSLNGEFINSIELHPLKSGKTLVYQFYPTEEALKTALILGEINQTPDISDLSLLKNNLRDFKNYKIDKRINYDRLVTLFYDTQDKVLSDKRLREALSYALPNEFTLGLRNRTPYPPTLWVSQEESLKYFQDIKHAELLLGQSQSSGSAKIKLNIKTSPKYKSAALDIANSWEKIGLKTNIEIVNSFPSDFQIFLGEFNVSKDPDQYALWHSSQPSNITKYKNLRIDKLLEDGRQTTNSADREKIYSDFQKYLLDDPPASFLYFPYYYTISK